MSDYTLSVDLKLDPASVARLNADVLKSIKPVVIPVQYGTPTNIRSGGKGALPFQQGAQRLAGQGAGQAASQAAGRAAQKLSYQDAMVQLKLDQSSVSKLTSQVKSAVARAAIPVTVPINGVMQGMNYATARRQMGGGMDYAMARSQMVPPLPAFRVGPSVALPVVSPQAGGIGNAATAAATAAGVAAGTAFKKALNDGVSSMRSVNSPTNVRLRFEEAARGGSLSEQEISEGSRLYAFNRSQYRLRLAAKIPEANLMMDRGFAPKSYDSLMGSATSAFRPPASIPKSFSLGGLGNAAMRTGRLASAGGDYELMLRRIMSFGGSGAISLLGVGGMAAGAGIIGHKLGTGIKEHGGEFLRSTLDNLATLPRAFGFEGSDYFKDKKWSLDPFKGMYESYNPAQGLVKSFKQIRHEVEAIEKLRLVNLNKSLEDAVYSSSRLLKFMSDMEVAREAMSSARSRQAIAGVDTSTKIGGLRAQSLGFSDEFSKAILGIGAGQSRIAVSEGMINKAQADIQSLYSAQRPGRKMSDEEKEVIRERQRLIAEQHDVIVAEKANIEALREASFATAAEESRAFATYKVDAQKQMAPLIRSHNQIKPDFIKAITTDSYTQDPGKAFEEYQTMFTEAKQSMEKQTQLSMDNLNEALKDLGGKITTLADKIGYVVEPLTSTEEVTLP